MTKTQYLNLKEGDRVRSNKPGRRWYGTVRQAQDANATPGYIWVDFEVGTLGRTSKCGYRTVDLVDPLEGLRELLEL